MYCFTEEMAVQLWEDIHTDNAVLFLGQNYQRVFSGHNFFQDNVAKKMLNISKKEMTYKELWKELCEQSLPKKQNPLKAKLNEIQKDKIIEIGSDIPQNEKLGDLLNYGGWASIITSAIDTGIIRTLGFNCDPIYNVNMRLPGLANKKRIHVTYMCGCVNDENSFPTMRKFSGAEKSNARQMYNRVIEEAIRYQGSLIIDGWDPNQDWIGEDILFEKFDAFQLYPKIYIFSATDSLIEQLENSDSADLLIENQRVVFSNKSFYEWMKEFLLDKKEEMLLEQATQDEYEILNFIVNKKPQEIRIPKYKLRELDESYFHLLTSRDRSKVSLNIDGLRGATIRFLSNSGDSFPYWQGYQQDCYFNRDMYENSNNDGLKDKVMAALRSHNLHQSKNTIILRGPCNSGKTIMLGKLAVDMSRICPVLFIKGNIPSDYDSSTNRYQSVVDFVDTYLSRPCSEKRINHGRVLVIWDNDAFHDKLQDYYELARELGESNVIFVGSAYLLQGYEGKGKTSRRTVATVDISAKLNPLTEMEGLYNVLANNLGKEYAAVLEEISKGKGRKNESRLFTDDTMLLSLIQRLFSRSNSQELKDISFQAEQRVLKEIGGNSDRLNDELKAFVENSIIKATKVYETDSKGLACIVKDITSPEEKKEEWYRQIEKCAPVLDDMLAVAGQFHIALPVDLVWKVISDPDICPNILNYIDEVQELLEIDTMLENPFPVDEINRKMVVYRSPEEANIYLQKKYISRNNKIDPSILLDENGNPFLEDREIDILKLIIEYSHLDDYEGSNFYTVKQVKELIDQFGTNSRKGSEFAKKYIYKYDELAACILESGGAENPETALSAAFLRREKIKSSMLASINQEKDITEEERRIIDAAADGLETAIEKERTMGSETSPRMMRLYIEWCTNRNYSLHREHPTVKDIELYGKIHNRFASALRIYMALNNKIMKPTEMLDVYLNGFTAYADIAEKLFGVQSYPNYAEPVRLMEYTRELNYAITWAIGRLLDFDFKTDHRNLLLNIRKTYELAKSSMASIESIARAKGDSTFISLKARSLWMQEGEKGEIEDLYRISDYNALTEKVSPQIMKVAQNVYSYLTAKEQYGLITSSKALQDNNISCLEMLIRSTWIIKTGYMPFTYNQYPKLVRKDWDELYGYCKMYTNSGNDRARYAFAYFFMGVYSWVFTADLRANAWSDSPSRNYFESCNTKCYRPRGLDYSADSFMTLCEFGTDNSVAFRARIDRKADKKREEAEIVSATDDRMNIYFPFVLKRKGIYCANSLKRYLNYSTTSQSVQITIRFNLHGALAGPVKRGGEADLDD